MRQYPPPPSPSARFPMLLGFCSPVAAADPIVPIGLCRARYPSASNGNSSMYYSVNVGPAHFLMLNSYISFQNGSAQFAFVEQDLAAYAAANQRYANGTSSGLTPYVTLMDCIVNFVLLCLVWKLLAGWHCHASCLHVAISLLKFALLVCTLMLDVLVMHY